MLYWIQQDLQSSTNCIKIRWKCLWQLASQNCLPLGVPKFRFCQSCPSFCSSCLLLTACWFLFLLFPWIASTHVSWQGSIIYFFWPCILIHSYKIPKPFWSFPFHFSNTDSYFLLHQKICYSSSQEKQNICFGITIQTKELMLKRNKI
jgi:hypothetical protein